MRFIADLCPCSLEYNRSERDKRLFVLASYQVEEGQSGYSRHGSIQLFDNTEAIQTIETAAVFDTKWSINNQLAAVTALGETTIYSIENSFLSPLMTHISTDQLCLSVDWNKDGNRLLVSQSSGKVQQMVISESQLLNIEMTDCHEYEAWTCVYDTHDNNVWYSGGDDSKLTINDIRSKSQRIIKGHDSGVTSITKHPLDPNTLLTGSYDEHVRIWDLRMMKSPKHQYKSGGGVWRMRWNPKNHTQLLIACMYEGFQVLEVTETTTIAKLCESKEHGSIAYGADWSRDTDLVATCSFYDRLVTIWNPIDFII